MPSPTDLCTAPPAPASTVTPEEREPIEYFIREFGIPVKLKHATCLEDISKSLAGRDCKGFAEHAEELMPELLLFAHAPQAARQAEAHDAAEAARKEGRAQRASDRTENVFTMALSDDDDDDDGDDDSEEAAQEDEDRHMVIERDSLYWDNFFAMCSCFASWTEEEDTVEFREKRATKLFNAGSRAPAR